ncbi:amidohydrolase family protein [Robertkochia solimangrovi]|uniref:amidohydrolase family protein n=1 Tax=Robertkochia solimangrovi TaxID=2213046 RepID=UPI001180D6EB|nr:amidohydrolase family protein [Robertkochia solimangrovi]TRZ41994.1 amidohydrolase [Robertkochia solimangrovi]
MKLLKRLLKIISILAGLLLIAILVILLIDSNNTSFLKPDSEASSLLLVKNVNIIPMTSDTVLYHKDLLIENGKISRIADSINETEAEILEGNNRFLLPGLIDMHVHVWDKYELGLYLANGVTSVRNLWGIPMHLRLKEAINSGNMIAPEFFTSGPKLTGPEFIGDDNLQLTTVEEAKAKVSSYKERGYDFIKTYYGLTPDLYDAILEQAELSNMDVVAHASQNVDYTYHFNPQIASIEHTEDIVQLPLDFKMDTLELQKIVDDFIASPHTSFCPTLTVFNNIHVLLSDKDVLSEDRLKNMNPLIRMVDSKAQYDRWEYTKFQDSTITERIEAQHNFHLFIVKQLHDNGVRIICGTDAGIGITEPGRSIHQEMAFYKEAGLSNYEVLKTATANPGKTHKLMQNLGTVEVGKHANLLLVETDPTEDLKTLETPTYVLIKGMVLNQQKLNLFKEKAADRNNLIPTALRYAENLWIEK